MSDGLEHLYDEAIEDLKRKLDAANAQAAAMREALVCYVEFSGEEWTKDNFPEDEDWPDGKVEWHAFPCPSLRIRTRNELDEEKSISEQWYKAKKILDNCTAGREMLAERDAYREAIQKAIEHIAVSGDISTARKVLENALRRRRQ